MEVHARSVSAVPARSAASLQKSGLASGSLHQPVAALPLALVVMLSAGAVGCQSAPPPRSFASGTAIVDVSVIPLDREAVLAHHTVVVQGDRIVAVEPSEDIDLGSGVDVIDGAGRFLVPGLIDAHVHITRDEDLPAFVAAGVTTVRNMWGNPPATGWRDRIDAGELVGPEIYTSGPIIDGDPPWFDGSITLTDPAEVDALVQEHIDAGHDFVKVLPGVSAEVYEALLSSADDAGLPVDGHVPHSLTLFEALDAGQRTFEHLYGFAAALMEERPEVVDERVWMLSWAELDGARFSELVARCRDAGAWVTPTLYAVDRMVFTEEEIEARIREAERAYVHPEYVEGWKASQVWPPETADHIRSGMEVRKNLVNALNDVGVPILAGTDSPNPFVPHGFALAGELEMLVDAGLTPFEALAAATTTPARLMAKESEVGRLREGHRADLVLLDADPLVDIAAVRKLRGVMLRGEWFSLDDLAELTMQVGAEVGELLAR